MNGRAQQIKAAIAKRAQQRAIGTQPAKPGHKCGGRCVCGAPGIRFSPEAGWTCGNPPCLTAAIAARRRAKQEGQRNQVVRQDIVR